MKEKIVSVIWESDEVERFFSKDGGHWWRKMIGIRPNFDWERPELPDFENRERLQFVQKWMMK